MKFRQKPYLPIVLVSVISFFITILGCTGFKAYWNIDTNLIKHSYKAAEELIARVNPPLSPINPVIIASFVDVDDMEKSSTLGRTISEYMASRISQLGYKVIEIKLRKSIFVKKDGGEFILSRKAKDIANQHQSNVVVTGLYSTAINHVNLSARIVSLTDSIIIASYDFQIPLSDDIREMLKAKTLTFSPSNF
jgi:TolB-like protein